MRTGRSGIRDNRSRGAVHEFITERAVPDSRLSVVSAYFTTFAYDRLRTTLDGVEHMRFLFGEPQVPEGRGQCWSRATRLLVR